MKFKGTKYDDVIHGVNGENDLIYGLDGSDNLYGYGGNDIIYGDGSIDRLYGGEGNDELIGGEDTDYLFGNGGNDNLSGGVGNDYLYDVEGNNILNGGAGHDDLRGGPGASVYIPGTGDDLIYVSDPVTNQGNDDGMVDTIVFEAQKKGNLGHDTVNMFEASTDVLQLRGYSQEDLVSPVSYQENHDYGDWVWNASIDLNDGTLINLMGVSENDPSFELGKDYFFL
jgi:serralysin